MELDELVGRYLVPGTAQCPTFVEDTAWVPVIDGAEYFAQVLDLIERAGPGDSVFAPACRSTRTWTSPGSGAATTGTAR